MLNAVSELGVLLLLLLTGMETDLALVKRGRCTAAITSAAGIVVPFACGYVLGEVLPENILPDPNRRLLTSLFLATAMSISSVKIVAAVLREADYLRRNLGQDHYPPIETTVPLVGETARIRSRSRSSCLGATNESIERLD